jgi:hypothetical protein
VIDPSRVMLSVNSPSPEFRVGPGEGLGAVRYADLIKLLLT